MKTMSRKEFKEMYENLTIRQMAIKLGVSDRTICNLRIKLKIQGKGKGAESKKINIVG